jgi:hypothetical protein
MAHFAELNENNIVIGVYVISNNDILDDNGVENEQLGIDLCKKLFNGNNYKQTSYNTIHGVHATNGVPLRKNYAGLGYSYDPVLDAFIPPQPFVTWTLNTKTGDWEAPITYPSDGQMYFWNEDNFNWELMPD